MRFSTKCWSEHILSAYKATKDLKHLLYMTFKREKSILFDLFHVTTTLNEMKLNIKFCSVQRIRRTCSFNFVKITTLNTGQLAMYRSPECWEYDKMSGYWGKEDWNIELERLGPRSINDLDICTHVPIKLTASTNFYIIDYNSFWTIHSFNFFPY